MFKVLFQFNSFFCFQFRLHLCMYKQILTHPSLVNKLTDFWAHENRGYTTSNGFQVISLDVAGRSSKEVRFWASELKVLGNVCQTCCLSRSRSVNYGQCQDPKLKLKLATETGRRKPSPSSNSWPTLCAPK